MLTSAPQQVLMPLQQERQVRGFQEDGRPVLDNWGRIASEATLRSSWSSPALRAIRASASPLATIRRQRRRQVVGRGPWAAFRHSPFRPSRFKRDSAPVSVSNRRCVSVANELLGDLLPAYALGRER